MTIVLRLIHILSGMFWAGTLLFATFYLFPALKSAGPGAGVVMEALQKRGFLLVLPVSAILTVLSGATLLWIASGGSMAAYSRTPVGRTFSMAGGLAILAFLIGVIFARPDGEKLMRLTPQMAATPAGPARAALEMQIAALQRRSAVTTLIVAGLVILAAAGMAVARYM